MRLRFFVLVLAVCSGLSAVAGPAGLDGTWKYSELDGAFQVRLRRGGDCLVIGATAASIAGYSARCTYELDGPNVDIHWQRDGDGNTRQPLRLVLVGGGALMRVEGEAKRPLHRVWDEPPDPPAMVNLNEPGALAALEHHDPAGFRKVSDLIDLVKDNGCRGAVVSEIKALVQLEFIACGSMDSPPTSTHLGFWLGGARFRIEIPPG